MGNNFTPSKKSLRESLDEAIQISFSNISDELVEDTFINSPRELELSFEQKEVKDWLIEDFVACFEFLKFNKIEFVSINEFIKGTMEINKSVYYNREYEWKIFSKYIRDKYEEGFFSKKFVTVTKKVLALKEADKIKVSEFIALCECLSNYEKIKAFYLENKDYDENLKFIIKNTGNDDEDLVVFDKDEKMIKLKIKLIITETIFNSKQLLIRKIISPVLSKLPNFISPKFGLFHTAILLGPFYLEFTNNELIIPKRTQSSNAIVSVDMEPILIESRVGEFERIKKVIAQVIETWNTQWTYSTIPNISKKRGNCQTFIEDIFKRFNISLDMQDGGLTDIIEDIRKHGTVQFSFKPTEAFIKDFRLKQDKKLDKYLGSDGKYKIVFNSHKNLDNFCFRLKVVNFTAIKYSYGQEYKLLKAIDRAFWLRHLKDKSDKRYRPAPPNKKQLFGNHLIVGCPFKDPRESFSFLDSQSKELLIKKKIFKTKKMMNEV